MWNNRSTGIPPSLDPCNYGWEFNGEERRIIRPSKLPAGIKFAPDDILKSTKCKCSSSQCKLRKCSCVSAGLRCTDFCQCSQCENQNYSSNGIVDFEESNDSDGSDFDDLEMDI